MWEYLQVSRSYRCYFQNKGMLNIGMSGLYFGSKDGTISEAYVKTKPQRQLELPTRMCNSMPCNIGHTVVGSSPSFAVCIMTPEDTNNPKMAWSITNSLNALVQQAGREHKLNTKLDLIFNISTWFKVISVIYVLMAGSRPFVLTAPPSSDFTAATVCLVHLANDVTTSSIQPIAPQWGKPFNLSNFSTYSTGSPSLPEKKRVSESEYKYGHNFLKINAEVKDLPLKSLVILHLNVID